jgi:uncharacterized surface protein with fasciclin (FAS1) repeats
MRSTILSTRKYLSAVAAVSALGLLAACGSDDTDTAATDSTAQTTPDTGMSDDSDDMGTMDPAANLVGPGCGDYAEAVPDGAGSVDGMAQDPVATAASNNPLLTTLTAAVSGGLNPDVDLVDTLNGGEFTVFAPTDDAFAQVPADTIETLKTDADLLSTVLTYHVVEGQITPDQVTGKQTTLQGEELRVKGSGDDLTVNGASVICGGVQTANATVYLVDSVLLPTM